MHIRLRDKRGGDHVHTRVFVGPDKDHLALAGELTFNVGEWQLFGAALFQGVARMYSQGAELTIDAPDATEVVSVAEEDARNG